MLLKWWLLHSLSTFKMVVQINYVKQAFWVCWVVHPEVSMFFGCGAGTSLKFVPSMGKILRFDKVDEKNLINVL